MDVVETLSGNGVKVTIYYDEFGADHADPRQYDGRLGIMLADGHRRYTLGDESYPHAEYVEAQQALHHFARRGLLNAFPRWCRIYLDSRAVLPLGLYDHSGITMYVGRGSYLWDSQGWDSGLIGFIFDSASTRRECGLEDASPERVEEMLRDEVEEYDLYITGQVYGCLVSDMDNEELDHWGGFLGLDAARAEASTYITAA